MKFQIKNIFYLFLLLVFTTGISSCVKEEFDAPPTGCEDPALSSNISIKDLKQNYFVSGAATQITDDLIINGIVIADDRSGNYYKTIVIQDESAGIAIRLDMSDYYTRFPVGRRVFVKLKGLYIGAYNNLIQIGANDPDDATNVATIPLTLVEQYIIKGECNLTVTPVEVSIIQLNNSHQNMLIRLSDVEFQASDTGKTFADPVAQLSQNRTLKDCNNNSIIVRTSGFANFAGSKVPAGNGTVTAIYTVFGTTPQLTLRDLSDVSLTGTRCGTQPGGSNATIMSIRNIYTGAATTIPANRKIKGIVISDKDNGNIDSRNMVLQDSTGGIVVRFSSNVSFALNAEVEVDISGQELSAFNGLLQVNNVSNSNATQTGTGTITPKVATISQVNSNFSAWESTLVKILNVTITGSGGTYNGSKTLNDGTGTITLYTRSAASFSATNHPTTPVDITGILIPFNTTKQISIRNLSDVQ
jgi:DNA/RNA endonuclease YhcR with UshA esterase domain